MMQVQQSMTFSFIGDGSSNVFSYDMVQPPFTSVNFVGEEFTIGSPASITAVVTPQMISGTPVNWAPNTSYPAGRIIEAMDSNGFDYAFQCTVAGTSGSAPPSFPFVATQTVQESSGVLWTCLGLNTIAPVYSSYTATVGLVGTVLTLTFNAPLPSPTVPITDVYGNTFVFSTWIVTINMYYNSYS
jgi:hypothetical protein